MTTTTKANELRNLVQAHLEVSERKPKYNEMTNIELFSDEAHTWQSSYMSSIEKVRKYDKGVNVRFEGSDCNGSRIADLLTRGKSASMARAIKIWAKS